jgi:hypothetical protein
MSKKWEFEETQGDWTVRGSYDEPDNIEFLHKGEAFHTITYPSYKIWNMAAHLQDYIPELEEELKKRAKQQ